jgi:hypothetical protein
MTDTSSLAGKPSRPNSHHRRRSSVSTRRESAELMGVSVPDLPASVSDDNINLGEKDSIRRRALWALEGKPDVSYVKVEIPELSTPDIDKKIFDFPSKPSFPPGFGGGSNFLGKRDSFKLLASSSSSKDQLHTLVEEEEEEEETSKEDAEDISSQSLDVGASLVSPTVAVTKPSPARPRPARLSLRPLSLTPDNLVSNFNGLPTPTLSPSPRPASLKSFSLTASQSLRSFRETNITGEDAATKINMNASKRQSPILTPEPSPSSAGPTRRPSLNVQCDSPSFMSAEENKQKRRSSISYKCSNTTPCRSFSGLPTPDLTPTAERRHSGPSAVDDPIHSRPLSVSEQHFLFKSHNALLARITDLERALSYRPRSRPVSYASDAEPSDEMLQLIADLKAERDELKRDVDGWRTRVSDLEKQVGVFAKRVEAERREAWVARSRLGLLEVEKGALEKSLNEETTLAQDTLGKYNQLQVERHSLEQSLEKLQAQVTNGKEVEHEITRLRTAHNEERQKREALERQLEHADLLATPIPLPVETTITNAYARKGFPSVDSQITDVDSEPFDVSESNRPFGLGLKAVVEEEENDHNDDMSDDDNGLAGYEDEDSDISFQSPGGSSLGSVDEYPRSVSHLFPNLSSSNSPSTSPANHPHAFLPQVWTFPKGSQVTPSTPRVPEEVDRFFGCLDDVDVSPPLHSITQTYEASKGLFAQGFRFRSDMDDEDDLPPFFLPSHVGVEAVEIKQRVLEVVAEEEEYDDEDTETTDVDEFAELEIGDIKITLSPPETAVSEVLSSEISKTLRVCQPFEAEDEDDEILPSFNFGQPRYNSDTKLSSRPASMSPSSIPRAATFKLSFPQSEPTTSTPPRATVEPFSSPAYAQNGFVTPPTKRGGIMPSFIPQPVSPLRTMTPLKKRVTPVSTFIPQPQNKPAFKVSANKVTTTTTNAKVHAPLRSPSVTTPVLSPSKMKQVSSAPILTNIKQDTQTSSPHASSFSSILTSPLATRLSTFTNYIPLSWAPRASQPGAAAAALCLIPDGSIRSNNAPFDDQTNNKNTTGRAIVEDKTKYVSKEDQLEKLRSRLAQEMKGTSVICRSCGDDAVFL